VISPGQYLPGVEVPQRQQYFGLDCVEEELWEVGHGSRYMHSILGQVVYSEADEVSFCVVVDWLPAFGRYVASPEVHHAEKPGGWAVWVAKWKGEQRRLSELERLEEEEAPFEKLAQERVDPAVPVSSSFRNHKTIHRISSAAWDGSFGSI
jgi:hypothetical protein